MKVDKIALYSNDSEVINFDMTGPDPRNPYVIKAITGLDAEEIVPRYYASGLLSGTKFNELALSPREITIRIGLKPNYRLGHHPADLRGRIMKTIASSRSGTIQLRFLEGGVCWGAITGFITKFEAPLTSKDTEIQFTMKCPDPIIRSLDVTAQSGLSTFSKTAPVIIDPVSTSPHGFKFKITITSDMTPPWGFQDATTPDWKFQLNNVLLDNDQLYFSSEYNDKYLYLVRSAVTYQLMDQLAPGSIWPMIFPGENVFDTIGGASFQWDEIYWYETHWGVCNGILLFRLSG